MPVYAGERDDEVFAFGYEQLTSAGLQTALSTAQRTLNRKFSEPLQYYACDTPHARPSEMVMFVLSRRAHGGNYVDKLQPTENGLRPPKGQQSRRQLPRLAACKNTEGPRPHERHVLRHARAGKRKGRQVHGLMRQDHAILVAGDLCAATTK